ncbi:MAG: hypothetical protein ABSA52_09390 [Candidatus Binatia bacterium]|jgi:hypothetical protein
MKAEQDLFSMHASDPPETIPIRTYLLRYGDAEYVLRRPPLGPVAPTSHVRMRWRKSRWRCASDRDT